MSTTTLRRRKVILMRLKNKRKSHLCDVFSSLAFIKNMLLCFYVFTRFYHQKTCYSEIVNRTEKTFQAEFVSFSE